MTDPSYNTVLIVYSCTCNWRCHSSRHVHTRQGKIMDSREQGIVPNPSFPDPNL